MSNFIDIHNHMLPGIDDGPRNLEESLKMAKSFVDAGIHEIIVTPHFEEGLYENYKEKILEETEKFRLELMNRDISLKLYPGCEIMATPCVPKLLKEKKIMTMKNQEKFVLIEFPLSGEILYDEYVIDEIKKLGLIPIVAHPERYREIKEKIIVENIVQINIGSLIGRYGNKARKEAEKIALLKNNKNIFYATDAHRVDIKVIEKSKFL